jgi:hypothetical protein
MYINITIKMPIVFYVYKTITAIVLYKYKNKWNKRFIGTPAAVHGGGLVVSGAKKRRITGLYALAALRRRGYATARSFAALSPTPLLRHIFLRPWQCFALPLIGRKKTLHTTGTLCAIDFEIDKNNRIKYIEKNQIMKYK